jgi:hypothetical protein
MDLFFQKYVFIFQFIFRSKYNNRCGNYNFENRGKNEGVFSVKSVRRKKKFFSR